MLCACWSDHCIRVASWISPQRPIVVLFLLFFFMSHTFSLCVVIFVLLLLSVVLNRVFSLSVVINRVFSLSAVMDRIFFCFVVYETIWDPVLGWTPELYNDCLSRFKTVNDRSKLGTSVLFLLPDPRYNLGQLEACNTLTFLNQQLHACILVMYRILYRLLKLLQWHIQQAAGLQSKSAVVRFNEQYVNEMGSQKCLISFQNTIHKAKHKILWMLGGGYLA